MPSTQRARSSVPLDQRSVVPSVPGVPAWGAVLIALVAGLLGVVMDSIRGDELTATFASLYVIGCIAAVLAVRHRGLFTAIAQPPLIIFVGVPLAYQFLSDDSGASLKDIVLNVAIPLVNRFPLMIGTTVVVLILGVGRLLVDKRPQRTPKAKPTRERATRSSSADRRDRTPRRADPRRAEGRGAEAKGAEVRGAEQKDAEAGRSRRARGDEPKTSWPPSDPTRWSRGDSEGLSAQRPARERPSTERSTRERPSRESAPRRSERSAPSEPSRRRDRGDYPVPPGYDSPGYTSPGYEPPRRDDRNRGRSGREEPTYETPRRDAPRHQESPRTPPRTTGVRRPDTPERAPYPAPRVRYRDRE